MRIIDFDAPFHKHLEKWMRENAGRFKNADEMEEHAGSIYVSFINQRFDWLDGLSPSEYFQGMNDARALVAALYEYRRASVQIPELMLARITELGQASVEPLLGLVRDEAAGEELKAVALNLLIELDTDAPMEDCFRLIDRAGEGDMVAEVAAELIQNLGCKAVPGMLARIDTASTPARATYLDLLCNFPGDERIYTYTVREFLRQDTKRALFATLLGRLGDHRAIDVLQAVLSMEDINYLDYLEIANAIEMLGGDAGGRERDFSGDPYYESLRGLS